MFAAATASCPLRAGPALARSAGAITRMTCSASAQIEPSVASMAGFGTPAHLKWTLASSKGLSQDASRYEAELRGLFASDDKEWALDDVDHGKLMFREVTGADTPGPVSRWVVDFAYQHGASSLFNFLVSIDGFAVIDPTADLTDTRTNPCERFTHRGIEGYTCAPVATFESMGNVKMACPNAVWFDDGIFLNWPCVVPQELRPAYCAESKRDYLMVYSLMAFDKAPGVVELHQLMWVDFLQGERGKHGHKAFVKGFHDRLVRRLGGAGDILPA
eukprot:jgi/Ulvmu1/6034/UM027_0010.1